MGLTLLVEQVLEKPSPEGLWHLHAGLLASRHPEAPIARDLAGHFFRYLSAVQSKIGTRQFPVIATGLAVTSTGINVTEEIFSNRKTNLWNLTADGFRLALDTLSTYQFVRQWETDFAALHAAAAWELYAAFWRLSETWQPAMPATARAQTLEELFTPVRDPDAENALRLAVMIRLFQWGLAAQMLPVLRSEATLQKT
ncbi:MAG: hypothetical protein GYB66_06355 [Chloroflexi bacterium]|nr:hypothetical protein [Chloroflexota bacterium]